MVSLFNLPWLGRIAGATLRIISLFSSFRFSRGFAGRRPPFPFPATATGRGPGRFLSVFVSFLRMRARGSPLFFFISFPGGDGTEVQSTSCISGCRLSFFHGTRNGWKTPPSPPPFFPDHGKDDFLPLFPVLTCQAGIGSPLSVVPDGRDRRSRNLFLPPPYFSLLRWRGMQQVTLPPLFVGAGSGAGPTFCWRISQASTCCLESFFLPFFFAWTAGFSRRPPPSPSPVEDGPPPLFSMFAGKTL